DGGRTWNSVAIPTARSISFINPREGWLLTMGDWVWPHGSDQSILHSTDGGKTWTGVSGFHSGNSFRDWIAFLTPATGWMTEQRGHSRQAWMLGCRCLASQLWI